jgi:sugar phosphate isomerase/epimerase
MIHPKVYTSTTAFGRMPLAVILNQAEGVGLTNLELSSGTDGDPHLLQLLLSARKHRGFSFLIHNYFPPPSEPFVLNLASKELGIRVKSIDLAKRALDLCAQLGATIYSIHAGFCFDAAPDDLGNRQGHLERISLSDATGVFLESIAVLVDEGKQRGVQILIENNVVTTENLIDGASILHLGVTASGLRALCEETEGLGVLLDLGHLKVSSKTLGLDPKVEFSSVLPLIGGLHLSDNDGVIDSNQPVTHSSWFNESLAECSKFPVVLEVYGLSMSEIKSQVSLVESIMRVGAMSPGKG